MKFVAFFAAIIATTQAAPAKITSMENVETDNSTVIKSGGGWAKFCDDDDCSVNCGISVDVENPGCLIQRKRGSIQYSGPFIGTIALLASPGEVCGCQETCSSNIWSKVRETGCFNLENNPGSSYRFIHGGCPENNCDN